MFLLRSTTTMTPTTDDTRENDPLCGRSHTHARTNERTHAHVARGPRQKACVCVTRAQCNFVDDRPTKLACTLCTEMCTRRGVGLGLGQSVVRRGRRRHRRGHHSLTHRSPICLAQHTRTHSHTDRTLCDDNGNILINCMRCAHAREEANKCILYF